MNIFQHIIIAVFTAKISEIIFDVHCKKRNKTVQIYAKCTSLNIQMNIHRDCFARDSLEKLISKHIELNRKKKKTAIWIRPYIPYFFVMHCSAYHKKKVTGQNKLGTLQSVH